MNGRIFTIILIILFSVIIIAILKTPQGDKSELMVYDKGPPFHTLVYTVAEMLNNSIQEYYVLRGRMPESFEELLESNVNINSTLESAIIRDSNGITEGSRYYIKDYYDEKRHKFVVIYSGNARVQDIPARLPERYDSFGTFNCHKKEFEYDDIAVFVFYQGALQNYDKLFYYDNYLVWDNGV